MLTPCLSPLVVFWAVYEDKVKVFAESQVKSRQVTVNEQKQLGKGGLALYIITKKEVPSTVSSFL